MDIALKPTKDEFLALQKACEPNRLSSSLKLIFRNLPESRIRGFILGCQEALDFAFDTYISPLSAFKWLIGQTGFIYAQKKVIPNKNADWIDQEVARVFQTLESLKKLKFFSNFDDKKIIQITTMQVAHRMQRRHYWLGILAKALCDYHYPNTQELGQIRKKSINAGQKIDQARQALLELTEYTVYMPWIPLPDQELIDKLQMFSNLLQPGAIKDLSPISRADDTYKERLFVIQMSNGHERYFQKDDGIPSAIADLFYLEGFTKPLDERTIRRICAEQQKRRTKADQLTAKSYSNLRLHSEYSDS